MTDTPAPPPAPPPEPVHLVPIGITLPAPTSKKE